MADYMVKFIAHIVEALRPEGFPRQVTSDLVVRVVDLEGLKNATNAKLVHIIQNNGIVILKDPDSMQVEQFKADAQIFVPMHMIAFLETETSKLASDIPEDVSKVLLN